LLTDTYIAIMTLTTAVITCHQTILLLVN